MNDIQSKQTLGPDIVRLTVASPKLSRKARPGQFVILRVREDGERFPLTIADANPAAGTIDL
ncbi:MAG TPA: sulfide/dihydroorotate dehydrogenase-like FAD/NAD-binding protein, partial [Phycisphaerae bacterium]|nr:sulfide/dihydroorotate dehydrogenase-like FAD/NAD-binding protein [Phycisphaerae bacterium]